MESWKLILNDKIKLLEQKRNIVKDLEVKVRVARKERNNLAFEIIESGLISIRQVAKHAGVSNVRLVQLRKARKNVDT